MSEILPNIHRLEIPLGKRLLAQHLLIGERLYLVDTGVRDTPEQHLFPYLETIGRNLSDVSGALITHPDSDHFGGNGPLHDHCPQALIMAHAEDAPLVTNPKKCITDRYDFETPYGVPLPAATRARLQRSMGAPPPVDLQLQGGERLWVAEDRWLEIIHAPGHSAGHLILYDAVHKAAIVTDAVLGASIPTAKGDPYFVPTYRLQQQYLRTIEKLRRLRPRLLLTSHFPVMDTREAIDTFLEKSEQFVHRLNDLLYEMLSEKTQPVTLSHYIDYARDRIGGWASPGNPKLAYYFCFPAAAALDEGVRNGKLQCSSPNGINRYRLAEARPL